MSGDGGDDEQAADDRQARNSGNHACTPARTGGKRAHTPTHICILPPSHHLSNTLRCLAFAPVVRCLGRVVRRLLAVWRPKSLTLGSLLRLSAQHGVRLLPPKRGRCGRPHLRRCKVAHQAWSQGARRQRKESVMKGVDSLPLPLLPGGHHHTRLPAPPDRRTTNYARYPRVLPPAEGHCLSRHAA